MRLAFISNIQGDLSALQAVSAFLLSHAVDRIYHLGNLAGFPYPNEVIRFMFEQGIMGVQGNLDYALISRNAREEVAGGIAGAGHLDAIRSLLAPESVAYLKLLPLRREVRIDAGTLIMAHALPEEWMRLVASGRPCCHEHAEKACDPEVYVSGHAHQPSVHRLGSRYLISAGSVSPQHEGDPGASVVLIDMNGSRLRTTLHRAPRMLPERTAARNNSLSRASTMPAHQAV